VVRLKEEIHAVTYIEDSEYFLHILIIQLPEMHLFFKIEYFSLKKKLGLGLKVWEERMQKKDILKSPNPSINIKIK